MKAHSCSILIGIGLFAIAAPVKGQIRDTQGSVALLAMNCSASSGYAASNYEEYCSRLAKTLGVLSGEQQRRVFGYLPTPAGGSIAEELDSDDASGQTPVTSSPVTSSPTTESSASVGTPGNSGNTNPGTKGGNLGNSTSAGNSGNNSGPGKGLIEQIVDTANTTVTNTSDTAAPVVDALTGIDLSPTTQALTNATQSAGSNGSSGLQDFWNSVISFFQALQKR